MPIITRIESANPLPGVPGVPAILLPIFLNSIILKKRNSLITTHYAMAEREGFEPSVRITVQRFSRPSRSTTPASFQVGCKFSHIFWNDEKKLHFFPKNLKLIVPGGGLGVLVFAD